ncbi:hypothetical protein [Nonomuraea insulae]|uniref:Uncharacterized protein n=1 Tax=Nonomuraea insulae TaxID=1616787 RepID=A0ABW1CUV2_9ACTN
MLFVFAVLAAAGVGAVVWWLRRDPAGGEGADGFEGERKWGWQFLLEQEAAAAFMEGLRAYHEAGGVVRVGGEQGVLTTYEPPRLISLYLLADAFAARGDAALHDPQGTVEALMEQLAAAERPGVLHLRPGWLEEEVDGLDAARFAAAVGEVVGAGSGEAGLGALQVSVSGSRDDRTHVNGTPVKALAKTAAGDGPSGETLFPEAEGDGPNGEAEVSDPGEVRPTEAVGGGSGEGQLREAVRGGLDRAPAQEGGGGGEGNTMMLDLARVLDLYREARENQPDAAAGALLREVVPKLIAAGGPGLTWTKPPTPAELRMVLGNSPEVPLS